MSQLLADMNQIISGEKLQSLADIIVCSKTSNKNNQKFIIWTDVPDNYDNPRVIFVYGHDIIYFSRICHNLKNKFILITHNSDVNIVPNEIMLRILNQEKCSKWYGQNVAFEHPKLFSLPIGFANSHLEIGNLNALVHVMNNPSKKIKNSIYFQFTIRTNGSVRRPCYDILSKKGIPFLPTVTFQEHLQRLSGYEYCICPEGNGLDTHRLWECFYLKVIPIVKRSQHIEIISHTFNLPMIIVDNWEDIDAKNGELLNSATLLDTTRREWNDIQLSFDYWKNKIMTD